jgi:hypothetical protein
MPGAASCPFIAALSLPSGRTCAYRVVVTSQDRDSSARSRAAILASCSFRVVVNSSMIDKRAAASAWMRSISANRSSVTAWTPSRVIARHGSGSGRLRAGLHETSLEAVGHQVNTEVASPEKSWPAKICDVIAAKRRWYHGPPLRIMGSVEELAMRASCGCYTRVVKWPALTLHRRSAPSEPLHCIYNRGLGVVAQGGKQVLVGADAIDYDPGQSMLTTIDLPVVSHVTRASVREPFLGMMLTLDVRAIVQIASEIDAPRSRRDDVAGSISLNALDAALLDGLIRLSRRDPQASRSRRRSPGSNRTSLTHSTGTIWRIART